MKNAQKLVAGAFAVTALSALTNGANAQTAASTSASGSVSIVTPLTMTKTADLSFGQVLRPTAAGSVTIDTAGNRTLTSVTAGSATATGGRAAFVISGEGGLAMNLSIGSLAMVGGGATIPVTLSPAAGSSSISLSSTTGAQVLTLGVGGIIALASGQAAANYTGTFTVSVNYN
jgi:hypothetical protein